MSDVNVATAENLAQGSIICLITQTSLAVGPVPSPNDMSQLYPALIAIGFLTASLIGSQDQEVQ